MLAHPERHPQPEQGHVALHRTHLLGLDARGIAQTEFGIGYAWRPQSRYGHYWVVLIARPADGEPAASQ